MTLTSDQRPATTPGDIPKRSADMPHPVKPKDSASMLVLRKGAGGLEVLMGRRGRKAVFSNAYVFAGGKVDKTVTMKRLDAAPDLGRGGGKKPFAKKKPFNADKPAHRGKFKPSNKGKKPYKSQFEKTAASGPGEPGSSPLKRKKKKKNKNKKKSF